MVIERFAIYLAPFDPTVGVEMGKVRPCVVISPDDMHQAVRTVIVAPLTSTRKRFPYRVDCTFDGTPGQIALDQMRSFDRIRFIKLLGKLDAFTSRKVVRMLHELFRQS
jgi:mRNA interferase MazF